MQAGQYITDGTVRWLVVDIRDGSMVGDITYSPILRPGHVKANGALLQNASVNYPRLVNFATENNLLVSDDTAWEANKASYVYDDASDTLRVPDAGGRVLQGGASVQSMEAGLPNITGAFVIVSAQHHQGLSALNGAFVNGANERTSNVSEVVASNYPGSMTIDASRSNPIYSASQTVQPPALTQIAQIRY